MGTIGCSSACRTPGLRVALRPAPRGARSPTPRQATQCAASGVRLAGCGSSVPEQVLTNDDLAKLVETNDEWITSRTGIKQRHILSEGESLSGHGATACQRALEMAGAQGRLWL